MVAGILHRAGGYLREPAEAMRATAALCESSAASAFSSGTSFWIFRIERLPPRLYRLLSTTPGLELYLPVTDNVAVAVGYRHPIHLEACRASFAAERLHLFAPRGVTEVAPLPAFAAIEDLIRIRAPSPEIVGRREAAPAGRPDLAVALRLEQAGDARPPVATLIPWGQVVWLQRLVYALPPTALRAYRVVLLKRGRPGAGGRRARRDPVRDAVPARRARGAGSPGDADSPRGLARGAGGAPGRDGRCHGAVPRPERGARCGSCPRRSSPSIGDCWSRSSRRWRTWSRSGGRSVSPTSRSRSRTSRSVRCRCGGWRGRADGRWRAGSSRSFCCRSCGVGRCASGVRSGRGRWPG